ncbi:A24 family peptidase [Anaerovibrio sp. JC8]|uniref:prepilin peptidase n=1 Tax=Anaerovibrio sp. JC8 TaxID=1240085 RepID=UPI001177326D|nr:A24 family peptidase [Anaerovibrio sp. JC8]
MWHIFLNNIMPLGVFIILGCLLGRGLLSWSGALSREYESELDTFIPIRGTVAESRWLLAISGALPLLCAVAAYIFHGLQYPNILYVFIVSLFLIQFSLTDFLWQVIFDKQLALFALLGLTRLLLSGQGLMDGLVAAAVGFAVFLLLAVITRGGFGGGDVKLVGAMGLWLGSDLLLVTVIMGIIMGGIMALLLLITKKRSRKDYFPYGPYFAITGMVLFLLCVQ